jgi:post-segregation antitoxin (ccd killing protein)
VTDDDRFLAGLLWIATTPVDGKPTIYDQAEQMLRGVGSMRRAGVPEGLIADAYRQDIEPCTALAAAMRWARHPRKREAWEAEGAEGFAPRSSGVLALVGFKGTGKSAALARLVGARIDAGLWRAKWVDCRGLVATDWDQVNALGHLAEWPCIVLDDLSAATVNREKVREAVAALLGLVHERRGLVGITSNLDKESTEAALGPTVWDRIRQNGEVVECHERSFRERVALADLDATIRNADRLTQLVTQLDRGPGWIGGPERKPVRVSDEVARLPRGEAIRQLGRLLGATYSDARKAAAESERHAAREEAWRMEILQQAAEAMKRPAKPVDLDTARRAHEGKVAKLRKAER